ncbi:unnamed protein product [Penicillium roqueforti FM164]|uniref:Uncharacterized protein n=1 Tax=Penicillium roqueforti (strain FM164) TaxID=1365484 RepID=W6QWF7_PENRF|nr:unnamed protein product [Penicillium roqueforti FM164]
MLNLELIKCDIEVEKTVPKCGHKIKVSYFKDITSPIFCYPELYIDILSYGYNCSDCYGNCL